MVHNQISQLKPDFLNFRRHRQLLLWPGTSHEAPSNADDPQPAPELWTLQEDGDLSSAQSHAGLKCLGLFKIWANPGLFLG